MRPESTSVVLRRDLAAVSQEFDAERAREMFIGLKVAPIFEVPEATGNFPVLNRESFKKPQETRRAPGARFNRIGADFGYGTFTCEEHGLEYPIDDRFAKKYSAFIDAEQAATRLLRHQILLAHEMRVAAVTLNATSTFTQNAPATVWSTSATATPLDDLITGCNTLEDNIGIPRSQFSLIIPRTDLNELVNTAQVIAKTAYTYPGLIPAELTTSQIAAMLGIKEVIRAGSAYDSKEEGYAESMSQIWTAGRVMLCMLAQPGDPLEVISVARTMLWTRSAPEMPVVESYRDDPVAADIIRMRDDTDEILTAAADLAAYVLTT